MTVTDINLCRNCSRLLRARYPSNHTSSQMSLTIDVWTSMVQCVETTETRQRPGQVRDAIIGFLRTCRCDASTADITSAVAERLNGNLCTSSVRSYLRLNTPDLFERTERGHYRLRERQDSQQQEIKYAPATLESSPSFAVGRARLVQADCVEWLKAAAPQSIHAVVTDPPYGLVEYSDSEQEKLRSGRGGVWRQAPSFDGHQRSPLPRFTILSAEDHVRLTEFFRGWAAALMPALVPGAHVLVASNPLVSHLVCGALAREGLDKRGEIIRLVMTMRGGDRPKNAHEEFANVSVMPRSMWEPWLLFRKPIEGRVQDNLRKWRVGGLRRPSDAAPFGDVIKSSPAPQTERRIAPHPSIKPQLFMRAVVRAVLPFGEGLVCDTFAGSGTTLAAAESLGYASIGIERDSRYFAIAKSAIPALARLYPEGHEPP